MSGRLDGRTALITGASRGIGRATAIRFGAEGASVIVNYRDRADAAADVVEAIERAGGRAAPMIADVADREAVERMVAGAATLFGAKIDILVNNAGVLHHGSVLSMDEDELDRMVDVNVKGIVHAVQAVAPGMIENGYGKIVNLSSLAGLGTAVAETTPYALTKAAVISLTKRMALELGPSGINVNAICPGFIQTDMLAALGASEAELAANLAKPASKAVLGRVGQPDDIAAAALFLASDEASFITAQVLTVDGGRMDFLTHSA